MAGGGEEAVVLGDESDEEQTGDKHEGGPVLRGRRPGFGGLRGQRGHQGDDAASADDTVEVSAHLCTHAQCVRRVPLARPS